MKANQNENRKQNKKFLASSIEFEGTGISIHGWWVKDGGKADVYIDGTFIRTIDCYYNYGNHEHKDASIFHLLNLQEGKHKVKLVVKGEKRPESQGCVIDIGEAVIFKSSNQKYLVKFLQNNPSFLQP